MEIKQIKAMTAEEIKSKIDELRKEMIKHNTQISSGASIKSPGLVRNTKRTIAKLLQELKNKEKTKEK